MMMMMMMMMRKKCSPIFFFFYRNKLQVKKIYPIFENVQKTFFYWKKIQLQFSKSGIFWKKKIKTPPGSRHFFLRKKIKYHQVARTFFETTSEAKCPRLVLHVLCLSRM